VWLTTTTGRQKKRNWQHQPAVALSITNPGRPFRCLEICLHWCAGTRAGADPDCASDPRRPAQRKYL
jgi:hypothetical protein